MAQSPPVAYSPPTSSVYTELWVSESSTGTTAKQIFGVQEIPPPVTPRATITYSTLESDTEMGVPGIRPYEEITVPTIFYSEQYEFLEGYAKSGIEYWWWQVLPESHDFVLKWRGAVDVAPATVTIGDMITKTITIGKTTVPERISRSEAPFLT